MFFVAVRATATVTDYLPIGYGDQNMAAWATIFVGGVGWTMTGLSIRYFVMR